MKGALNCFRKDHYLKNYGGGTLETVWSTNLKSSRSIEKKQCLQEKTLLQHEKKLEGGQSRELVRHLTKGKVSMVFWRKKKMKKWSSNNCKRKSDCTYEIKECLFFGLLGPYGVTFADGSGRGEV